MTQLGLYSCIAILVFSPFSTTIVHAEISTSSSPISAIESDLIYDTFPGTISQQHDQLTLNRCGSVSYVLQFNHPEDEQKIRDLLQQYSRFWLDLRASAYEKNDRYYLKVEEIAEIYRNETCHFSELLSDLDAS